MKEPTREECVEALHVMIEVHGLKRTEQMLQEALARIKAEHDDSC